MSIDKAPTGTGWGCLRFGTAFMIGVFIFIGLVSLLTFRFWPLVVAGTALAVVVWWGSAKSFGWRWALWGGPLLALFFAFVFVITGYLIHSREVIPGR